MVTVEATSVALAVAVTEAGVTGVGVDPLGGAAADEVVSRSGRADALVLGPRAARRGAVGPSHAATVITVSQAASG